MSPTKKWVIAIVGLLGGNVIARSLGPELIAEVSGLLRESIRYALTHRDEALSALLSDLTDRGLLEDTLVLVMGEFGRTPRINSVPYPPDSPSTNY